MSRDLLTDLLVPKTQVWQVLVDGDAAVDEVLIDEGFIDV